MDENISVKSYPPHQLVFASTHEPEKDYLFQIMVNQTNMEHMGIVITPIGIQKKDSITEDEIHRAPLVCYSYVKDGHRMGLACIALCKRAREGTDNYIEITKLIGSIRIKSSVGHIGHLMLQFMMKNLLFDASANHKCMTLSANAGTIAYLSRVMNFRKTAMIDTDWMQDESGREANYSDDRVPKANGDNIRCSYNFVWGELTRRLAFEVGMEREYALYKTIEGHTENMQQFVQMTRRADDIAMDPHLLDVYTRKFSEGELFVAFKGLLVKKLVSNSVGMFDNAEVDTDLTDIRCGQASDIDETICMFSNKLIGTTQFIQSLWYNPLFFLKFDIFRACHAIINDRAKTTMHILTPLTKFYRTGIRGESVIQARYDTGVEYNIVIHNDAIANAHPALKVLVFYFGIVCCQIPQKPQAATDANPFKRGKRNNAVDLPRMLESALMDMGIHEDVFARIRAIDNHFAIPLETYDDDVKALTAVFDEIIQQILVTGGLTLAQFATVQNVIEDTMGLKFIDVTKHTARMFFANQ